MPYNHARASGSANGFHFIMDGDDIYDIGKLSVDNHRDHMKGRFHAQTKSPIPLQVTNGIGKDLRPIFRYSFDTQIPQKCKKIGFYFVKYEIPLTLQ